MFLRRRSQRVRHAESDTAVVLADQDSRNDSEAEQLKDELKHKVEDLNKKVKDLKVCARVSEHASGVDCGCMHSWVATFTRRVDFFSRLGS